MKVIFETSLGGHRYEYLHNLYVSAGERNSEDMAFVLPYDDRVEKWKDCNYPNLNIDYLSEEDILLCTKGSLLVGSYYKSKILCKYVRKYSASSVFLIFLMLYMPTLVFLLPQGTTVSGIVYRSFLWEDALKQNRLRKLLDWLRYWLMARSRKVRHVLMLNDTHSANTLNECLHTKKFLRLPDPYTPLEGDIMDLREQLGIAKNDRLFITIGQLDGRKSVIETLDAIALLSEEERQSNWFYFAGRVAADVKEKFYSRLNLLVENGCHVFVKDEFVSFEFLNSLCASCDCILVPYRNTCQSSGCIGYAAQYGKSVIGPSQGLLGYLIRHYHLGATVDTITPTSLYNAFKSFRPTEVPDSYVGDNRLEDFLDICLE